MTPAKGKPKNKAVRAATQTALSKTLQPHNTSISNQLAIILEAFKESSKTTVELRHDYGNKQSVTRLLYKPTIADAENIATDDNDERLEMPDRHTNCDDTSLMQEGDADELTVTPPPPVAQQLRYKLLTDGDLSKLPPIQWIIKNVLPSHGMAVVYGPSGSGKSFLVLHMLQSIAAGTEWFGQKVKQHFVTYIALEGEAGLSNRIKAYHTRHGSISSNIRYLVQPFNLLDADDINDLAEAIKAAGTGGVVVLDTLSRATPGVDENDGKAMGEIIDTAKLLQGLIGGLVLLVHHTGKDASKGMRGHSSLHAALDCAIEVKRNGDRRKWHIAKVKDGEDGASYPFNLDVVLLGQDNDGDDITSCVIVPDQSTQAIKKKIPSLGSNQRIAYKALGEQLLKSVDFDKEGMPPGKACISFDDALAIVTPLMSGDAKHKKERAKEAITGLGNNGVMGINEDWLWDNQS
jgi:putative DNA primase/helicase